MSITRRLSQSMKADMPRQVSMSFNRIAIVSLASANLECVFLCDKKAENCFEGGRSVGGCVAFDPPTFAVGSFCCLRVVVFFDSDLAVSFSAAVGWLVDSITLTGEYNTR